VKSVAELISPHQADDDNVLWARIPTGYVALPLDDTEACMSAARDFLHEMAPEDQKPLITAVTGAFTEFLGDLRDRNTAYCGLGFHVAPDGTEVTSSLVVSLQRFRERRNPRLVLGDLARAKAEDGEVGQADLVDLDNGPAFFFERLNEFPAPTFPGHETESEARVEVFQLQALVPSADGTKLAALEFSTPFVSYGSEFRTMMVLMATTVSFEPPLHVGAGGEADKSIADMIRGL
jgi:hypothetical protein